MQKQPKEKKDTTEVPKKMLSDMQSTPFHLSRAHNEDSDEHSKSNEDGSKAGEGDSTMEEDDGEMREDNYETETDDSNIDGDL